MSTRPGFFAGFTYPFRGIVHLLRTRALWKWAALPFAVNLVLYSVLAGIAVTLVHSQLDARLASWPSWLRTSGAVLAYALVALVLAVTFTIIGNIVAAPLLDILAERSLCALRGRDLPHGEHWLLEAALSVGRQLVKLAVFLAVEGALLLLVFVPVVYPVLATIVAIAFLALEYLEYPMAAERLQLRERYARLFRHARASLGFGTAIFLLTLVPLASYVALPTSVVGAVLLHVELSDSP